MDTTAHAPPPKAPRGRTVAFAASIMALIAASAFTGAALAPHLGGGRAPDLRDPGELAVFLEHAQVDVRLGRGAPLARSLEKIAKVVTDPSVKDRVLALWADAAMQSGSLADAALAEEQREALAADPAARDAVRLVRVGLLAGQGRSAEAEALAEPLIKGGDPRLADEVRLRLVAAMKPAELRAWVGKEPSDPEERRRAGMAALRLLADAKEAERLLVPLAKAGEPDVALGLALLDVYSGLERPADVARIAGALVAQSRDEADRARLTLLQADALARAGQDAAALAAVEPLRRSAILPARSAARRAHYEILARGGRLDAELRGVHDLAELAFVALYVQRDYARAVRLYQQAAAAQPGSTEIAEGAREAARRLDLVERRALYEQVLAKDNGDTATRDKLAAVLAALGDDPSAQQKLRAMVQEAGGGPDAILTFAQAFRRAGLVAEAAAFVQQALAVEADPGKRQQIVFALGDLYAEARRDDDARRLYTSLAAEGTSPEIRARAVARLVQTMR